MCSRQSAVAIRSRSAFRTPSRRQLFEKVQSPDAQGKAYVPVSVSKHPHPLLSHSSISPNEQPQLTVSAAFYPSKGGGGGWGGGGGGGGAGAHGGARPWSSAGCTSRKRRCCARCARCPRTAAARCAPAHERVCKFQTLDVSCHPCSATAHCKDVTLPPPALHCIDGLHYRFCYTVNAGRPCTAGNLWKKHWDGASSGAPCGAARAGASP